MGFLYAAENTYRQSFRTMRMKRDPKVFPGAETYNKIPASHQLISRSVHLVSF